MRMPICDDMQMTVSLCLGISLEYFHRTKTQDTKNSLTKKSKIDSLTSENLFEETYMLTKPLRNGEVLILVARNSVIQEIFH